MEKILDVRSVGWLHNLKDDSRSPESFAFPACMTSLVEYLGGDAGWTALHAHGREWTKRTLYDALLVATGMAFGLLWHEENCPSCMDLTQVNDHRTIARAFDYAGYDHEVMERTDSNFDEMKKRITASVDAGRPVLAFGIVGPPECGVICGCGDGGGTLFGWSHFQSHAPADCAENGMFRKTGWHQDLWKIVLCGDKKAENRDLADMIRRGCAIMEAAELGGYRAGTAAYDAWIRYISDPAYDGADDDALRGKYWLHHAVTGNHAEARCYLGGFLEKHEDARLRKAAKYFSDIHSACWRIWGAAGGINAPEGYRCLRDGAKREQIMELLREIKELDRLAYGELRGWLSERE